MEFWNVTYKVAFKSLKVKLTPSGALQEVGWRAVLLDEGPEYLRTVSGAVYKTKFKTVEGDPFVGNLNGAGGEAAIGDYYWNVFNQYDLKDFDALGNMGPY